MKNEYQIDLLDIYFYSINYPSNLVVWNNKHLLSHSFCRSGIQEGLNWLVLSQELSHFVRSCQPLRTGWWGVGSTSMMAHSLLVSRRPTFLPHGPLHQLHRQLATEVKFQFKQKINLLSLCTSNESGFVEQLTKVISSNWNASNV